MGDTDDFQFDSVVSDPGVYDGILGSAADVRDGAGDGGFDNVLTPSTHRAETPPLPPFAPGPSDSIPSIAASATDSEQFQLELGHGRNEDPNLYGSQQSQNGMKSGIYMKSSKTEFISKLKGDVVVSGRWSTIGDQGYSEDAHEYNGRVRSQVTSSRSPTDSDMEEDIGSYKPPFPNDQSLAESVPPMSAGMAERSGTSDALRTPQMTRTRSEQSGMPGRSGSIREQQALRSALRRSRSSHPMDEHNNIDSISVPPSPRTVSFAGLDPLSNSEISLYDTTAKDSALSSNNSTAHESIVFRSQESDIRRSSGLENHEDGDDMSTQPLQEDNEDPEVEDAQHYQNGDGSSDKQPREKGLFSSAVGIGIGMTNGVFRNFSGWSKQFSQQNSSSAVSGVQSLVDKKRDGKQVESKDGSSSVSDNRAGTARGKSAAMGVEGTSRHTVEKNESAMETRTSSLSTTSSLSSVQTEPMRSNLFSNLNTPSSAVRAGVIKAGTPYTTPNRRPSSSRKTSNTSSRKVNPLARHLAIKSILLAPSSQRGSADGSPFSSGVTPTHADRNGAPLPLLSDHQSMNPDGSVYDISNSSAINNLDEIQKQFDIFAGQLKSDASAAQADIQESEAAWNELQYEVHKLKTQLVDAETTRDFYQRQAEESEKNRFEWEQERQQLLDENNELQDNVDQWRQRIGDVESDRQGIWKEGTQSREQLLHAIARLETDLSESRAETSRIKVSLASATVEFDEKIASVQAERAELYENINMLIPNCEQLKDENQHMQADLYETLNELDHNRNILSQREAAIQHALQEKAMLAHSLDEARAKIRLVESHNNEAVAHIGLLERKLDEMAETAKTAEARESDLKAELASFKEAKELLQETLENVTEQNKALKDSSHDESIAFKTALFEGDASRDSKHIESENKPASLDEKAGLEVIEQLKAEHRDELARMKSDYNILVESMDALSESKTRYKAENAELTNMAENARSEIESLKKQLDRVKLSVSDATRDLELGQLQEREEQLKRELDSAEREKESVSERIQTMDARNKQLVSRNEELSQSLARLETELSDLQMEIGHLNAKTDTNAGRGGGESEEELELLHMTVDDLRKALSQKDGENDKLRQANANMDIELDDVRMELFKAQSELASEKDTLTTEMESVKSLQQANEKLTVEVSDLQARILSLGGKSPAQQVLGTPESSTTNSPNMDQADTLATRRFGLSKTVRELKADVNALEQSVQQLTNRREKILKEQRFLAEQVRDRLLDNKSLRNQLTEFLLRRAGKLRELQMLRNADSANESYLNPDEASVSMMSGTVDMIPSTSQLLDSKNNGQFFKSLDKHLDLMGNIIDEADAQSRSPATTGSTVPNSPKRGDNQHQPLSGRLQKKVLTPIREEYGAQPVYSVKDASVQCEGLLDEDLGKVKKQLEDSLEAIQEKLFIAEEDCRTLRASVANVKQERDQFKASQEEAAERVSQLTGQIEELSENHERMKAVSITTARISLRVNRQLAVLKRVLSRLEPRETRGADSKKDDPQLSQIEVEEREDALIMEEDDAMMQATIDHPLRKADLALLGLSPAEDIGISGDGPNSPYLDGSESYDRINNDELLEQVGLTVSEAYAEIKRIRSGVIRVKRERSRLMKRLAEVERSKLPSYELSTQWGRKLRSHSYAEDAMSKEVDNEDERRTSDQFDDANPPASLFLADESAVMAEFAKSRKKVREEEEKEGLFGRNSMHEEVSGVSEAAGMQNLDKSVLQGPIAAAAEISRLMLQLKKKERRLRFAEKDRDKLEEFNRELVQMVDRAYAEKLRARQECNAMTLRTRSRAASRTATPNRGTDWDDFESIHSEMERCKNRNKEYFENVEKLCRVLNQHTLDRALSDYDDAPQTPLGSGQRPSKSLQMENVYRTLLIDMATTLDAKGFLDERKSIRENFNSMAAAVRKRLDDKEAELKSVESRLEASRVAGEAAANASMLSAKATTTTEERMRKAERRMAELETDVTEAQQQITTYQGNVRSLNETISRLRQQCVAADSELQDARMERDGWNQHCIASQQSLEYQIEENNQLKNKLEQLNKLRSRDTRNFASGGKLGYGDQTTSIEWEQQLREEWTEATREETKQIWLSEVFALRQSYEAQIKIYSWANMLWSDIINAFVSQAMRDVDAGHNDIRDGLNVAPGGLSPSLPDALKASGESLLQAADDLNGEIDMAVKRAASLQESMRTPNGMNSYQDKGKRTRLVDELNGIVHDLIRDFSGAWRENVRECIVAIGAALAGPAQNMQLVPSGGNTANNTPTSANSGSSSSGQPQLTSEQKAKIRKHHEKKLGDLQRQWSDRLQEERSRGKAREREAKAKYRKDMQMVIAEKQYYRGRLNIMHDRYNFMKCQKKIIMKIAGGQDTVMERVDRIANRQQQQQKQQRQQAAVEARTPEERRERIRSLWSRALLAVRLCNGLYGMYAKSKEINAIKENVLNQMSGGLLNGRAASQVKWSQPETHQRKQQPQQQGTEPSATRLDHGGNYSGANGNHVPAYHYGGNSTSTSNNHHRYAALSTAPLKSSSLRHRSSDLRSSTGSSMN
ncbi:hypothetical protein LPJ72_000471 [Coemansia sp. Benny D160-2]|nr:hypothetical protein LPJ72_000471 [Coemansia sp. Benny D160-2]